MTSLGVICIWIWPKIYNFLYLDFSEHVPIFNKMLVHYLSLVVTTYYTCPCVFQVCHVCFTCTKYVPCLWRSPVYERSCTSLLCTKHVRCSRKRKHERHPHPMSKCIPCPGNKWKKSHVLADVYRMPHVSQRSTCERCHNALSVYRTCNTMCVI